MVVLSVLFIVFASKYSGMKKAYEDIKNTSSDTLSIYKNKLGEMYVQRNTYITDIKNLKKNNSELYKEIKNLKDHPVVVTKVETVTEIRDKVIKDTVTIDPSGNYAFNIKYDDEWVKLNGKSIFNIDSMVGTTKFDYISFPNTITVDIIDKNGQLSFIAKSNNPYCQINNLNGSIISPEKSEAFRKKFDKKWSVVLGVGPTVSVKDNKIVVLPGLQLTFGRKLFSF